MSLTRTYEIHEVILVAVRNNSCVDVGLWRKCTDYLEISPQNHGQSSNRWDSGSSGSGIRGAGTGGMTPTTSTIQTYANSYQKLYPRNDTLVRVWESSSCRTRKIMAEFYYSPWRGQLVNIGQGVNFRFFILIRPQSVDFTWKNMQLSSRWTASVQNEPKREIVL